MTSLALYVPRIIHSTSPLLNISLLYSAYVSQIMKFTPVDIPLPSAYRYDSPTPGKNKQKKNWHGFLLFLCFWRTVYCSNQSQGGMSGASKIRSLPRKTDSCKQNRTVRKTGNTYRRVTYQKNVRKWRGKKLKAIANWYKTADRHETDCESDDTAWQTDYRSSFLWYVTQPRFVVTDVSEHFGPTTGCTGTSVNADILCAKSQKGKDLISIMPEARNYSKRI